MSESTELTQTQAQLTEQLTNLTDLYHRALKETLFTNRAQIRPASLRSIAVDEAKAVLDFFQDSEKVQASQRGTELCQFGLGEEAILRLAQATRQFCLTHLPENLRLSAINLIEGYYNAVLQSFMQTREAIALEEQERIRNALQKTIQRNTLHMEVAADIARATASILDLDELLNTSVKLIQGQFGLYYVGLFLVDEDGRWAVLRASSGEAGQEMVAHGSKLEVGVQSLIGWCIIKGQAGTTLDTETMTPGFDKPLLPETRSELALPLLARDKVIGAITIQSKKVTTFSQQDLGVLQTMANQLAIAIENARLFENVARSQKAAEALVQETIALQHLSQALSGTLEFNEILDIFFQTCTKVLGFDFVIFSLVDENQQRVKAIAGVGVTDTHLKRSSYPLDSENIMADIIRTGQTEGITGWDDRLDRATFEAENMADWGLRIFTPITLRQENIGLVEVGFNRNIEATVEDSQIRLLRAFINQTALALDNAKRYEASQRTARREALIKEFTTKIRASANLDTILQTAVKEIGDAIDGERTYVHLISPNKQ
jgi:GAF domain-containing protein